MANNNQFDNYQLDPNVIGSDWTFSGDQVHLNRKPDAKLSNPGYYFVGPRMSADHTRTLLGGPDPNINPQPEVNDGWLGHGVDWAQFNYNPYQIVGVNGGLNPNFRVMNDWLQITGMGDITVVTDDVMDQDEVNASGMSGSNRYMNYPSEGWSSFGKKYDKHWIWMGNTWVPYV